MTTVQVESRYVVEPSKVLTGCWVILDTVKDQLARKGSGRAAIFPFRTQAEQLCARLNKDLDRRVICRLCRHKVPANDVMAGWCRECREGGGPDAA